MGEIYVDDNGIKYLIDEYGELHFICDRSLRKKLRNVNDIHFMKWEYYNIEMVTSGGKPILDYGDFLRRILGIFISSEDQRVIDEVRKKGNYSIYMKSKNEIDTLIRDGLGGFYFNIYKNLLEVNLEPQYIFRFVYLCTYLNYDNKLVWGNAKGDGKLAKEKDLMEILGLSQRETIYTKKALIKANLISIEEDKTISINKKYAIKGKINKRDLRRGVRMMENGIQELYKNVSAREHKRLALFIEILPYINFNHNIVCSNPSEVDIAKVEPITLKELCKIVGYDETKSTRLKNDLLKLKIDGENVVGLFIREMGTTIHINPRVYYKGKNIDDLRALMNMFKVKSK